MTNYLPAYIVTPMYDGKVQFLSCPALNFRCSAPTKQEAIDKLILHIRNNPTKCLPYKVD
jgi:hypothetical protein